MRRDYPAAQLETAVRTAAHYGLYDLDRLERMILRQVATDFFVLPADRDTAIADLTTEPGDSDEG